MGAVALKCGNRRGCKVQISLAAAPTALRYLHLFVGCDGTEDDLREALGGKHPEADAADDTAIFDQGEGLVLPVSVGKDVG